MDRLLAFYFLAIFYVFFIRNLLYKLDPDPHEKAAGSGSALRKAAGFGSVKMNVDPQSRMKLSINLGTYLC